MSGTSIEVVVLDCDGVILESVEAKTRAFAACFAEHGPEAQKFIVDFHLAHGGVSRYEKFRHFHENWLGKPLSDDERERLSDRFTQACLDEVLASDMVPGALDFLTAMQDRVPLYVASGTPEAELREVLEQRGLDRFFVGMYGSPAKKPDILRSILTAEGKAPESLLMVGDSGTDLDAAKAVGSRFVGRGPFPEPWPWFEDLRPLTDWVVARL